MADIDIDVDSIIARLLEGMYVHKYTIDYCIILSSVCVCLFKITKCEQHFAC